MVGNSASWHELRVCAVGHFDRARIGGSGATLAMAEAMERLAEHADGLLTEPRDPGSSRCRPGRQAQFLLTELLLSVGRATGIGRMRESSYKHRLRLSPPARPASRARSCPSITNPRTGRRWSYSAVCANTAALRPNLPPNLAPQRSSFRTRDQSTECSDNGERHGIPDRLPGVPRHLQSACRPR